MLKEQLAPKPKKVLKSLQELPANVKIPEKIREFKSFDEIPSDPKTEGLRPWQHYAGGDPEEIIVVNGVRYKKKLVADTYLSRQDKLIPMTEKQYYSHSFEQSDGSWSCGPAWGRHVQYLYEGWKSHGDPALLSDLPFYNLVSIEEKEV